MTEQQSFDEAYKYLIKELQTINLEAVGIYDSTVIYIIAKIQEGKNYAKLTGLKVPPSIADKYKVKLEGVSVSDIKMNNYEEAKKIAVPMLKLHEGVETKPYYCPAGKLTIGVGRNLESIGITEDEAEYLLDNDINRVVEELDQNVPLQDISSNRMAALIDMCFNIGLTSFLKFKKMLAALDNQDYELAAEEMLDSDWAEQVGKRAITLSEILRTDNVT